MFIVQCPKQQVPGLVVKASTTDLLTSMKKASSVDKKNWQ